MGGAGDAAQRLGRLQVLEGRLDGLAGHLGAFADRTQPAHGVGDLGHPAEAAAGAALQRALARQGQGLFGHGLQRHVHGHPVLALLDGDVFDVGDLGDGFGEGEAHHQVFQVRGRGHQHRMRALVVGDADGGLVGGDALDLENLGPADAPFQALAFHGGGEAFHAGSSFSQNICRHVANGRRAAGCPIRPQRPTLTSHRMSGTHSASTTGHKSRRGRLRNASCDHDKRKLASGDQ